MLPPGRAANVLQAFEDKPLRFDAWDIDIFYQQKRDVAHLVESVVEERGPSGACCGRSGASSSPPSPSG